MNLIYEISIFMIVLFTYLHIYHHLWVNNECDILQMQEPDSVSQLDDMCGERMPFVYPYRLDVDLDDVLSLSSLVSLNDIQEIMLCDNDVKTQDRFVPVDIKQAIQLLSQTNSKFISSNNNELIKQTKISTILQHQDAFFLPPASNICDREYDIITGNVGMSTQLKYDIGYRHHIQVVSGEIEIICIPPVYGEQLNECRNYGTREFYSKTNVWDERNMKNIQSKKITVSKGSHIYIPSYWWYSVRFCKPESMLISRKFYTYMNKLANCHIWLYYRVFNMFTHKRSYETLNIENETENVKHSTSDERNETQTSKSTHNSVENPHKDSAPTDIITETISVEGVTHETHLETETNNESTREFEETIKKTQNNERKDSEFHNEATI